MTAKSARTKLPRIRIGVSGFQYPEWKGGFYPEDLPASKMLGFYAEHFATTEINYSFRHLPSVKSIQRWSEGTPEAFAFSFKAPQRITHFAKLQGCEETMDLFREAIGPMGAKLGPVLFQLPPTFKKEAERLKRFLEKVPADLRVAWEFRHSSWFDGEIYEILRTYGAALCLAESEDLETPREITAKFGYLRLRREDYDPARLREWAAFLQGPAAGWSEAFVYFKHEATGTGPKFAVGLEQALKD